MVPSKPLKKFIANNFIEKKSFEDVTNLKKYFSASAKCIVKRLPKNEILNMGKFDKQHFN